MVRTSFLLLHIFLTARVVVSGCAGCDCTKLFGAPSDFGDWSDCVLTVWFLWPGDVMCDGLVVWWIGDLVWFWCDLLCFDLGFGGADLVLIIVLRDKF